MAVPRFCDPLSLAVFAAATTFEPFTPVDVPGATGMWLDGGHHMVVRGFDCHVDVSAQHGRAFVHVQADMVGSWSVCDFADGDTPTAKDDDEPDITTTAAFHRRIRLLEDGLAAARAEHAADVSRIDGELVELRRQRVADNTFFAGRAS